MSTCKDCIHYDICNYHIDEETAMTIEECGKFKNKADYVEVVYCKNCKHEHTDTFCQMWCRLHRKHEGERLVEENHFCSYGERKDT